MDDLTLAAKLREDAKIEDAHTNGAWSEDRVKLDSRWQAADRIEAISRQGEPVARASADAIAAIGEGLSGSVFLTPSSQHGNDMPLYAAPVPSEQWRLVPKEPTPEMMGAWYRYKTGHHFHGEPPPADTSDYGAYRAMLAAAPSTVEVLLPRDQ